MSEEITVRTNPGPMRRLLGRIFGHDYFIAYAHADGKPYAVALEKALGDEWDCFLDVSDFLPGDELSSEDVFALKKTQCLIFLATPAAFESKWVQFELDTFHQLNRRVIPIDFGGRLAKGMGKELRFPFEDTIWIDEAEGAWHHGPSDAVVEKVRKSFTGTRMIKKRINTLYGLLVTFVILAGVAGWFWLQSFILQNRSEGFLARSELALGTARLEQGRRVDAASHLWRAFDVETRRGGMAKWISERMLKNLGGDTRAEALTLLAKTSSFGPPLMHGGYIGCVTFSRDGKQIATGGEDGLIRFWDANTGKLEERIPDFGNDEGTVWSIQFDRQGKKIALARGNTAVILNVPSLTKTGPLFTHEEPVRWAELSPSGQLLVTAGEDATAKLWNVETGQVLHTFHHENEVHCARFSPDGQMLVTAGLDHQLKYWEVQTGRDMGRRELGNRIHAVDFSPDGSQIVTAGIGMPAQIRDFHNGELLLELDKGRRAIHSVDFSPDGRFVATGTREGTAQIWDAKTGDPVGDEMRHQKAVYAVAFDPGSQRVVTGSEDGSARVWDIRGLRSEPREFQHGRMINHGAFNPDGTRLAAADGGGMVFVWDWSSGKIQTSLEHGVSVENVSWSEDGGWIRTIDNNERVRVWNPVTRLEEEPPRDVRWIAPARAGRDYEDETRIELESGGVIEHREEISWFAYSPDGGRIATASCDRTARVWDASRGEPLSDFLNHPGDVTWIAFSPDGRHIATGCIDGFLRIWPAPGLSGLAKGDDPAWLQLSVEVRTGQTFDAALGQIVPLSAEEWWQRRRRLEEEFGGQFSDRVR